MFRGAKIIRLLGPVLAGPILVDLFFFSPVRNDLKHVHEQMDPEDQLNTSKFMFNVSEAWDACYEILRRDEDYQMVAREAEMAVARKYINELKDEKQHIATVAKEQERNFDDKSAGFKEFALRNVSDIQLKYDRTDLEDFPLPHKAYPGYHDWVGYVGTYGWQHDSERNMKRVMELYNVARDVSYQNRAASNRAQFLNASNRGHVFDKQNALSELSNKLRIQAQTNAIPEREYIAKSMYFTSTMVTYDRDSDTIRHSLL